MKDIPSIRKEYEQFGVRDYYRRYGAEYRNPHETVIRDTLAYVVEEWLESIDLTHVLDLACGSGEVTLMLRELGCTNMDGIDPYTGAAYRTRTGQDAEPYTFDQIAAGAITNRWYSMIVCSFALHLVEESRLPLLAHQLSLISDKLLILSPHKRPMLKTAWGWALAAETVIDRVRARLYKRISDRDRS